MSKKRILVVDNDPHILDVVKIILELNEYEVITSSNGKEALSLSNEQPALILLDLLMPLPDGVEVYHALKQNAQTKDIPVVIFSTHIDLEDISATLGADDWLHKPFEVGDLLEKVALNSTNQKVIPNRHPTQSAPSNK